MSSRWGEVVFSCRRALVCLEAAAPPKGQPVVHHGLEKASLPVQPLSFLLAIPVQIAVTTSDSEEWSDIIDEMVDTVEDPEFRDFLEAATVLYVLETSATRNALSLEFQEALWRMLGVLTYGLIYDPQEGRAELCSA